MSRPGKKITRKTITMNSKMNELQLKEKACKSLLANVLDMDDDLRYEIVNRLLYILVLVYFRYKVIIILIIFLPRMM